MRARALALDVSAARRTVGALLRKEKPQPPPRERRAPLEQPCDRVAARPNGPPATVAREGIKRRELQRGRQHARAVTRPPARIAVARAGHAV